MSEKNMLLEKSTAVRTTHFSNETEPVSLEVFLCYC